MRSASTRRPDASSICLTIAAASSSESSYGGRQLDTEDPLLRGDEQLVLARDLVEHRSPALLGDDADEVADELVGLGKHRLEHLGLFRRIELRVADQRPQLGHLVDRFDERAELVAHLVDAALRLGRLEERSRVRAGDDCHG